MQILSTLVLALLLLTGCTASFGPTPVPTPFTVQLTCQDCAADNVDINIFATEDRTNVIGHAPHGTEVTAISSKVNSKGDTVYFIKYGNLYGWVSAMKIGR